jgi:hypothetical protein
MTRRYEGHEEGRRGKKRQDEYRVLAGRRPMAAATGRSEIQKNKRPATFSLSPVLLFDLGSEDSVTAAAAE